VKQPASLPYPIPLMKRYSLALAVALAVALTLASAIVQGRIRYRWGPTKAMRLAAQRLREVPLVFGDWQSKGDEEMDEAAVTMLQCTGYIERTYANRRSGEVVNMFVVVGPVGPIAAHTPEVCFSGIDYKMRGDRQRISIRDADGDEQLFWAHDFKASGLRGGLIRTYYAWSAGDGWSAPENPRFAFTGQAFLYKLQLTADLSQGANFEMEDTCRRFLRAFVPEVKHAM